MDTTSFLMLPEGCISDILALTSPLDVCRLSLVSKSVQSAADSDSVWDKFLPSDYQSIIAESLSPIPVFRSKKDLYVYLCLHPILIDGGRKSFSLEKGTGKKCYFLGAKDINIVWSDAPQYWEWTSLPQSRFPVVARLRLVWWLEIWGLIRAAILSPLTSYVACLVYKLNEDHGFQLRVPSEVSVAVSGIKFRKRFAYLKPDAVCTDSEDEFERRHEDYEESDYTLPSDAELDYTLPSDAETEPKLDDYAESDYTVLSDVEESEDEEGQLNDEFESVYNLPSDVEDTQSGMLEGQYRQEYVCSLMKSVIQHPKLRDDGWFEIELGEFFSANGDDYVDMRIQEVKGGYPKAGLIVEGIEIRPRVS